MACHVQYCQYLHMTIKEALKMGLENIIGSSGHLNEQYKYQVFLGHLKLPSALHLAKAYMYDPKPYIAEL